MKDREVWLAEVFVELADTLTSDFDLIDFLSMLSERCAELLDGPQVGVMLGDAGGRLRHIASSTEDMRVIELLELQYAEGPCLDCYRTSTPIINQPLDAAGDQWPVFAAEALASGYRVVTALPLRLRGNVIGAMNIFHRETKSLDPVEVRLAQALADTATVGILQQRAVSHTTELSAQLQTALNNRITIEQAKGMVSEQLGVRVNDAFALLRNFARTSNTHLVTVATNVVNRSLPAADLAAAGDPTTTQTRAPRPPA
jgi:GAF domain-containing protein